MSWNAKDETGNRHGRLLVLRQSTRRIGNRLSWECECDCGALTTASGIDLRNGHTQSCGCLQRERASAVNTRHGHSIGGKRSPTHESWSAMRSRCLSPTSDRYEWYGARGITVCPEWNSFETFLYDMGERPDGTTLDRIDNSGNYEPGTCRWATPKQQANNRRPARRG